MQCTRFFKIIIQIAAVVSSVSGSSYFQLVDGSASKEDGMFLKKQMFTCDRQNQCTNVVRFEDNSEFQIVNGDEELKKITRKRKETWKKIPAPNNCQNEYDSGNKKNGVYEYIDERFGQGTPFLAFCNMETESKGLIVVQRRIDASVSFSRKSWIQYKNSFGNLEGNFWIGLEKLHAIAAPGRGAMLLVDVRHQSEPNTTYYAKYSTFEIGNEADGYRLKIGGYQGNAGDSFAVHNGMKFTTFDNDNDLAYLNCGSSHNGGWWHKDCFIDGCFLNGVYPNASPDPSYQQISWYKLKNQQRGIIYSRMMVSYY